MSLANQVTVFDFCDLPDFSGGTDRKGRSDRGIGVANR